MRSIERASSFAAPSCIPSPDTIAYQALFSRKLMKNVLQWNKPVLHRGEVVASHRIKITKSMLDAWHRVHATEEFGAAGLPYYMSSAILSILDVLNKARIPLSKLVHLRSSLKVIDTSGIRDGDVVEFTMAVSKIMTTNKSFVLCCTSDVVNSGSLIHVREDQFFIKNVSLKGFDVKFPVSSANSLMREIKSKKSILLNRSESYSCPVYINRNDTWKYSRLAGDYNVLHTSRLGARICGFKDAFFQGTSTQSLCWSLIQKAIGGPLKSMIISFTRPAFVESGYFFSCLDGEFELSDKNNDIIVFGEYVV